MSGLLHPLLHCRNSYFLLLCARPVSLNLPLEIPPKQVCSFSSFCSFCPPELRNVVLCRSQSIRSRRSLYNGDATATMLKYPGYPHHLGSWNTDRPRPSSLSLEQMSGTLPSPWTTNSGMKLPPSHPRSVPSPGEEA